MLVVPQWTDRAATDCTFHAIVLFSRFALSTPYCVICMTLTLGSHSTAISSSSAGSSSPWNWIDGGRLCLHPSSSFHVKLLICVYSNQPAEWKVVCKTWRERYISIPVLSRNHTMLSCDVSPLKTSLARPVAVSKNDEMNHFLIPIHLNGHNSDKNGEVEPLCTGRWSYWFSCFYPSIMGKKIGTNLCKITCFTFYFGHIKNNALTK